MPRGCRVYQGDIKVGIEGNYFYPDVVVQCGPRDLRSQVAAQPVVLAEVLMGRPLFATLQATELGALLR